MFAGGKDRKCSFQALRRQNRAGHNRTGSSVGRGSQAYRANALSTSRCVANTGPLTFDDELKRYLQRPVRNLRPIREVVPLALSYSPPSKNLTPLPSVKILPIKTPEIFPFYRQLKPQLLLTSLPSKQEPRLLLASLPHEKDLIPTPCSFTAEQEEAAGYVNLSLKDLEDEQTKKAPTKEAVAGADSCIIL